MSELLTETSDSPDISHLPRLRGFLWRGAVGGMIGNLVYVLLYMYRVSYARLFFLAFLMLLWIPAAYGSLVGGVLWLINRRRSIELTPLVRALVGVGIVTVASFPYVYFTEYKFVLAIGGNLLRTLLLDSILTGLTIGLPAGIMAPSGRRRLKHQVRASN